MRADDRVIDGRRRESLRLRHGIFAMAPRARKIQVMHGTQVGDTRFPSGIEPLVSAVHVTEMRFPAALGYDLAVDDGRLPRDSTPRTVRVPGERTFVRMPAGGLPVFIEIRESIELRVTIRVVLVHHAALHFPDLPGEVDLAAGG